MLIYSLRRNPRYAVVIIWSSGNYKYLEPRNYFYEWHKGNNSFRDVIRLSTDFSDLLTLRRPGKKRVFSVVKSGKVLEIGLLTHLPKFSLRAYMWSSIMTFIWSDTLNCQSIRQTKIQRKQKFLGWCHQKDYTQLYTSHTHIFTRYRLHLSVWTLRFPKKTATMKDKILNLGALSDSPQTQTSDQVHTRDSKWWPDWRVLSDSPFLLQRKSPTRPP